MKIFETVYEGTPDELAAYKKSCECTFNIKLKPSDLENLEDRITANVCNEISKAVAKACIFHIK